MAAKESDVIYTHTNIQSSEEKLQLLALLKVVWITETVRKHLTFNELARTNSDVGDLALRTEQLSGCKTERSRHLQSIQDSRKQAHATDMSIAYFVILVSHCVLTNPRQFYC